MKFMSLMVCGVLVLGGASKTLGAVESTDPITVSAPDFLIPLGGQSGTLDVYFDGRPAETSGFDVLGNQKVLLRANSESSGMVTLNLHLPGFLLEEPGSTIDSASLKFTVRDLDLFPDQFASGVTLKETAALTAVNGIQLVNPIDFLNYLPAGTRDTDGKEIALNPILLSQMMLPSVNFADPFVLSFTFTATATSHGLRAFNLYNAPEGIASNIRLDVVPAPPPVPEPSTVALAGLCAILAAWKMVGRRKV